jgi:alpha-1,3-glucosyltransferase
MLGLFLTSLTLLSLPRPQPVLAAIPFVLSLCFKQMALYYAPAIFIYLLSLSFPRLARPKITLLASLAIVVIITFAIVFLPFFLPQQVLNNLNSKTFNISSLLNVKEWDLETPTQIFRRVFPFGRGLWEDKVANIWCASNILIKWRDLYSSPFLQKLRYRSSIVRVANDSLATTMVAISPGLVYIWLFPQVRQLPHVFTLTALGFFLCSFQVHEKSILLPLLPASLSLFSNDPEERKWSVWINVIGAIRYISPQSGVKYSLWPLLKKDGLILQYSIFVPLWTYLAYEAQATNFLTRVIHLVCSLRGWLMRFLFRRCWGDIFLRWWPVRRCGIRIFMCCGT